MLNAVQGRLYKLDDKAQLLSGTTSSLPSGACYLAGDSLYCVDGNGFTRSDFAQGGTSGGFSCQVGSPHGFPSSLPPGSLGWAFLFECSAEPDKLRLMREIWRIAEVRAPEPVLTARLLADGKVTMVGQRGGIFVLDSVKYGDCCTLQESKVGVRTRISAGNHGMTAIYEWDGATGRLAIFSGRKLVRRSTVVDADWVEDVAWSESNRTSHSSNPNVSMPQKVCPSTPGAP